MPGGPHTNTSRSHTSGTSAAIAPGANTGETLIHTVRGVGYVVRQVAG